MKRWLGGLVVMLGTWPAAADFVVNNNSDAGSGSLRKAISDANSASGGTITFQDVTGTIQLLTPLPALAKTITIAGPGAAQLTVAGANFTVFTNSAGNTAALGGLGVTPGTASLLGSAIENFGTLTLSNCVVFGGRAVSIGGGLHNTGHSTVTNCTFSGIQGDGGGAVWNSGTLGLDHCTLTNNYVNGSGCCIYNQGSLTVDHSTVAGNGYHNAGAGGGLYNEAPGNAVVRNCSFTNNYAVAGGGIWNGGALAVTNCTIALNRATYSDGPTPGGGLYNTGTATVVNTTLSGNTALDLGGGLDNSGTLWLLNVTIASNVVYLSEGPGAGGGIWNSGTVFCKNSILAGNSAPLGPDFFGSLNSQGYNLVRNTCNYTNSGVATGNLLGLDPRLGPLQDNGGPTPTHALLPASPAIDAGSNTGAPTTDQRGVSRPQGLSTDIGAFEFQFAIPVLANATLLSKTNLLAVACGMPSHAYTLKATTNLVNWLVVSNFVTGADGVWQYFENPAGQYPRRFYRVEGTLP